MSDVRVRTDVLVIGGGMAGCFAAIKARDEGAAVLLVDKGYVSKSGQTPSATCMAVCDPAWGHRPEDWLAEITQTGEYVNDRTWTQTALRESPARLADLLSWGVELSRNDDGEPYLCTSFASSRAVVWEERQFHAVLRRQLLKSGVTIIDKCMVTNLLHDGERVTGAVGFDPVTGDFYIIEAAATCLCAGTMSLKPIGFPISPLTGDGDAMAYEVGAEISGKEFSDPMFERLDKPGWYSTYSALPVLEEEDIRLPDITTMAGEVLPLEIAWGEYEFEAHAGKAPFFMDDYNHPGQKVPIATGATLGMTTPRAAGVCLTSGDCETSVPGLFAAGDSASTMQQGSVYAGLGWNMMGCSVTGARAGRAAALSASRVGQAGREADGAALRRSVFAPLTRTGGFSPRWVTQALQNLLAPYFMLHVKRGDRLEAALTLVEFMRDHLVPHTYARDTHELRLAHETANMLLNAEMKLRSSLFRTESRGRHYREDYPCRDDPGWLAWTVLKKAQDGRMELSKRPLPEEWWPDLTTPYEERYPFRFPGEGIDGAPAEPVSGRTSGGGP